MEQRIVEILMYVIGEIQSRRIKVDEIDGISDELVQRGFTQREVATAMSLVSERLTTPEFERMHFSAPVSPIAYRVLHDIEKQYVSPDAFGYLIQLSHLAILDMTDIESLVERCMISGNLNIGLEEMKILVATHLLEKDPTQSETGLAFSSFQPWSDHVQ